MSDKLLSALQGEIAQKENEIIDIKEMLKQAKKEMAQLNKMITKLKGFKGE